MAKTLRIHHGVTLHDDPSWHSHPNTTLSVEKLKYVTDYAKTLGLELFGDGRYKGWIHPFGLYDLFNDFGFGPEHEVTVQSSFIDICGVLFHETVWTKSLVIFGKNSDPIDIKECFIGEPSTFD